MDPSKPGLTMLMDMINEKGKPVNLSIKYMGGPEIFGPFQGCESLQKGIVDMAYTAAAYNTGVIPEVDAMKLMQTTPWEDRKSGAYDLMNKWHNEKGLEFLARASTGQGFQAYLNEDRKKPDLKGLTMRVVPIYIPLIKALGAKGVSTSGVRSTRHWNVARWTVSGGAAAKSDRGAGTRSASIYGAQAFGRWTFM
ncbi:MAG: hypothetical protein U5R49_15835 [Deltaproteobacteria bacterium]|nr:hypothetical protein [Deltaproteobacteria bacterium]